MNGISTGGQWDCNKGEKHINFLELKAVLLALLALCKTLNNVHLRIRSDNITVVACIYKQGSTKPQLNDITREI